MRSRSVATLALLLALWSSSAGGERAVRQIVRVSPTSQWRASLRVMAGQRGPVPMSKFLCGKFCEHLGSNIYNGMWAQILRNPGFEPWRLYGNDAMIAHRVAGLERLFGLKGLARSRQRGIAFPWVACGQGEMTFALDPEAFNSATAQRVKVTSLPEGATAGVAQPIHLPVHREDDYALSFYARGDAPGVVALRRGSPDGPLVGKRDLAAPGPEWKRLEARFRVRGGKRGEVFFLVLALSGPGTVWFDNAELFPADNLQGFDPDVVRLWREARLPLLRYPGGNFASGYHWQDGIGPRHKRPTTFNRAWNQPEPNHVGTDEFMTFCRLVGAEPMICVNAGDGTPEDAAAWVEYCNGSPRTRWGKRRAENGHPEPYNVRIWEIGNELYGGWQIGHCTPDEYAERYERFHKAMKAVDPSIHLIANGQDRRWNEPLISRKGELVEAVSIHTLIGGGLRRSGDPVAVWQSLMAYPTAYEGILRALRRQMEGRVATPRIAITELQLFTNTPRLPNNQEIGEALFLAGTIHTALRLGDFVELLTHTATVNHGGGLRKVKELVYPNPVYFASRLYSQFAGMWPVALDVETPTTDVPPRGGLPGVKNSPWLDAVALLDDQAGRLAVLVVNRHHEKAIPAVVSFQGFAPAPTARVLTIRGANYRDKNTWDEPERVALRESRIRATSTGLRCDFPPASLTALVLSGRR